MPLPASSYGIEAARQRVEKFCTLNGLAAPHITHYATRQEGSAGGNYGWFISPNRVLVTAWACRKPMLSGRGWTWPGYTADLTVLGVTCHETGHYVNHVLGWRRTLTSWKQMRKGEPAITSYANRYSAEDFAEAFRLFLTNPSLLKVVAPKRHGWFTERFKPVEERHWREILSDSPRHIKAAENKVRNTKGVMV